MHNSIVVGPAARRLSQMFRPDGLVYTNLLVNLDRWQLWIHARACTRNGKPSGGLHVWADGYDDHGHVVLHKRAKNCQEATVYRHAADVAEQVRQQLARRRT